MSSHSAPSQATGHAPGLARTLGPFMLWGLGVGYVISGMYFGWNLGLVEGGPYGLALALVLVTVLYATFVLSYAELSCAIPHAGGAFNYALRAFGGGKLGRGLAALTGTAQVIEFVFAPPAIAAAIGAYAVLFVPSWSPTWVGLAAYALFTALNIWGVRQSAIFELVVTVAAVVELLIFAGVTLPHFSWHAFSQNPLPHGWGGAFAAIPYAIWFYLAIEGVANVAEEARNPQRDLSRGFGSAMATLVVLAFLTFFAAVGVAGWEAVVYPTGAQGGATSDSPLPLALARVVGENHGLYHLLLTIGIFGLVASFHGIILVAGRAVLEMGRQGFAPRFLGRVHPKRQTPVAALLVNWAIGAVALLSGKTGEIITVSVFGALALYILSMISLFRLRQVEPGLERPYHAPGYPWVPGLALVLSVFCWVAMAAAQPWLAAIFVGIWLTLSVGSAALRG